MKNKYKNIISYFLILIIFSIYSIFITSCNPGKEKTLEKEDASANPNTLKKQEITTGWRLLFDGKSLVNWRGLGMDNVPKGQWIIEDGQIKKVAKENIPLSEDGKPAPAGDLMTIESFENFEFSIEWKVSTGSNSGIKYNVSEELSMSRGGKHSALGFEYQVIDDYGYTGKLRANQTAGALYDLFPPGPKNLKPAGEFNKSRIILQGNHGKHWLNGKKILEFEIGSASFDSSLAVSKFRDITGFADKKKGHIVLQVHPGETWYRNIKIRELP
jgi:hypothetical protein